VFIRRAGNSRCPEYPDHLAEKRHGGEDNSMDRTTELLERIDTKLGALLALVLDAHLRDSGIAKPKERSIDRLLTDAGLSAQTIAAMLGKTDRAVLLALQREREAKSAGKKSKGKAQ
jgi:hypothetical protein